MLFRRKSIKYDKMEIYPDNLPEPYTITFEIRENDREAVKKESILQKIKQWFQKIKNMNKVKYH